ncbi:MAG: CHAT domain-containing protein, partial [Leptolyngbya sp. SIO3F4]|nr:CHAT domain-containing protein [Leptolyngbya sp. SIO3F4]
MADRTALKSILLLAANPQGTSMLRLQEEEREIREKLRLAGYGKVSLNSTGATRPRDIQQAMVDFEPQIVHFIGHGAGQRGLFFENSQGNPKLVTSTALANLFKLFSSQVECVVLNACHSEFQAKAIVQHIDYVVGMSDEIGDRAAIEFSVGFYTALGAGKPVRFAYDLGCNAIELEGLAEQHIPTLLAKTERDSSSSDAKTAKYMVVLSTTIDEVDKPLIEA